MSTDLVEIVHDLRLQMAKNGGATLSKLALAFKMNDIDGTGKFDFQSFEEIMNKVGLFCRRQELTKLYRYFDTNVKEELDYREFLQAMEGGVNQRRMNMISLVWEKLSCGQASVPTKLVIGAFNASNHPRVLSGDRTEQQIFRQFVQNFEHAGNVDGDITWEQFASIYKSMSAAVPYNDDYFIKDMEAAWGVTENITEVGVPTALVRKVENVLREKVRQRCTQDGAESEKLRLAFKYFDIQDSGLVDYEGFLKALSRFGVILPEKLAAGLLADFEAADGRINYSEFVAALYLGEAVTPSFSGLTQTIPRPAGDTVQLIPVLGGPVSGSSAFCARLKAELGVVHLNADDLVSASGAKPTSSSSADDVAAGAVLEAVKYYSSKGHTQFVLDGFPGSAEELEAWRQATATETQLTIPVAISLQLPRRTMELRLRTKEKTAQDIERKTDAFYTRNDELCGKLVNLTEVATVYADAPDEQVYSEILSVVENVSR